MAGTTSVCPQAAPPESTFWRNRAHLALFLILVATIGAYAACVSYDFVYDDNIVILRNPQLRSWASLPGYFTQHVFAYNRTVPARYYRPLFLVWLRIQYWLFGPVPGPWHAADIVLHLLVTALVFKLAMALSRNLTLSTATALLFGLHPVHVESVAWIDGSPDPLVTIFVLASFLLFLRYQETARRRVLAASLIFFACGLLTKEAAIVLPALIAVRLLWRSAGKSSLLRRFAPIAGYVFVSAVYLLVRHQVLTGAPPHLSHTAHRMWHVLLSQPKILWFYASHLLFPYGLSESYPIGAIGRFSVSEGLIPALGVALLAAVLLLLLYRLRRSPWRTTLVEAFAWLLLPLLPVLDLLLLPSRDYVHDRYLYLPSVGFCLLAGMMIQGVTEKLRPSPLLLRIAAVVAACGLALATHAEGRVWRNDETLYRRTLAVDPHNATMRNNLASYFIDHGRIAEAIPELQRAIADDPEQRAAHVNLAISYEIVGNLPAAQQYWQRAENIAPDPEIEAALARLHTQIFSKDNKNAGRALPNGNTPK